jgi:hypothetical protein
MAKVELTQAAAAIKEHFGERVVGGREEGRDMMVSALMERLELSESEAGPLVDALIDAHSIQYVDTPGAAGTVAQATMPFGEALGVENPAGPATSAEVPMEVGHWRL